MGRSTIYLITLASARYGDIYGKDNIEFTVLWFVRYESTLG